VERWFFFIKSSPYSFGVGKVFLPAVDVEADSKEQGKRGRVKISITVWLTLKHTRPRTLIKVQEN
jgi:hypothetical protein